ncbi:MAG: hypothetical protein AAGB04_00060 [Pseudomonadota bacterium]
MDKQELSRLRQQAENYDKMMRQRLHGMANASARQGSPGGAADHQRSMLWSKFVSSGEAAMYPNQQAAEMAFNRRYYGAGVPLQHGKSLSDYEVKMAMDAMGGNPYQKKLDQAVKEAGSKSSPDSSGSSSVRSSVTRDLENANGSGNSLLDRYLTSFEEQRAAANAANEERYQEGKGELSSLRDRTMERVSNYGEASRQDLEERFANQLGDIKAQLQASGLGNSTILAPFIQRNERDLAREVLRLSENVDDRAARYDQSLSNNLVDFIERRTDAAPDLSVAMQVAQQLGLSNDGGGFSGDPDGQSNEREIPSHLHQTAGKKTSSVAPQQQSGRGFGARASTNTPVMTPWGPAQQASLNPMSRAPIMANPIGAAANNMFAGLNNQINARNQQLREMRQRNAPRRRSPEHYEALRRRQLESQG